MLADIDSRFSHRTRTNIRTAPPDSGQVPRVARQTYGSVVLTDQSAQRRLKETPMTKCQETPENDDEILTTEYEADSHHNGSDQ